MTTTQKQEHVILLHGAVIGSYHLSSLTNALKRAGYQAHNVSYPCRKHALEILATLVRDTVDRLNLPPNDPVHYVGYSMGGLLIRGLLNAQRPSTLGRVVQIGTPNAGSPWADRLRDNVLYRHVYGPAGQQLTTTAELAAFLGKPDYELGCIAGTKPYPLRTLKELRATESDGTVSVASALLPEAKDHTTVHANHLWLPFIEEVHQQTIHFLQHGCFSSD